jgi:K+-transporting ATPase ATPase C chain
MKEQNVLKSIRQVVGILVLLTVITGVIYPLVVTGVAQLVFPHQANGSIIVKDGKAVGSELIGQQFSGPEYFWPRPSATLVTSGTVSQPYNAVQSSGSNLGPLNPDLADGVKKQVGILRDADPTSRPAVPVDLVTASGSGLDPDISVAAAEYQVPRVAAARQMDEADVRRIVAEHTLQRQMGLLGEPRVNVLELNLAIKEADRRAK